MSEMEIIKNMIDGVGSAAMLLAMTNTISDEQAIKDYLTQAGYKAAVTELGGNTIQEGFQVKLVKSVLGAVLNNNVIAKEPYEVHAVLHAAMEAKKGIVKDTSTSANIAVKISVVRKGDWIAVGIFGQSAVYHLTNHERSGLGVMHI